jgi:hypothetical protein
MPENSGNLACLLPQVQKLPVNLLRRGCHGAKRANGAPRIVRPLTWIAKKQQDPEVTDLRGDARFVPPNPHSTMTLADGSIHPCFIIDYSVSGVAVSAAVQPPVGMPLAVGACGGRVVRLLPNGVAIQFVQRQTNLDLDRLVVRTDLAKTNAGLSGSAVARETRTG